jgi:hypothetical protein
VLPLLILTFTLAGCGGEGGSVTGGGTGGVIDDPLPTVIGGEWATNTTEVLDTCGFDPYPSYAPLQVEESGNSVIFTFNDGYGTCEQSVRQRSGDTVTLTRSDTFDAGCGVVRVQSNIVYNFTTDTISGHATHQYSMLYGYCGNVPCTYELSIAGTRCDGCFTSCVAYLEEREILPTSESTGIQAINIRKR